MNYYLEALRKYAVFSGRATRSEYWFFVLFNGLVVFLLAVIVGLANGNLQQGLAGPLTPARLAVDIYYLFVLLPSMALLVRRLHDTGKSGSWVAASILAGALSALSSVWPRYALFLSIPTFGLLLTLLVFTIQDSESQANRYGPNPKVP